MVATQTRKTTKPKKKPITAPEIPYVPEGNVVAELLRRIEANEAAVKKLQKLEKVGNKLAKLQERVDKLEGLIKTMLLGLEEDK